MCSAKAFFTIIRIYGDVKRRGILIASGTAIATLAGCIGGDSGTGNGTTTPSPTETTAASTTTENGGTTTTEAQADVFSDIAVEGTELVVTEFLDVGATVPVVGRLPPDAYFGVLLGVEMVVALVSMVPVAKAAERVGLKPVVALGFAVYAVFPVLLISAPADPLVVGLLFAETCRREIPDFNLPSVSEMPKGAVGYRYLARSFVLGDGETLYGPDRDISPWVFWGEAYDEERVKLVEDNAILLSNMRNNGMSVVCRTWRGNFMPIGKGDKIHPPPEDYIEHSRS